MNAEIQKKIKDAISRYTFLGEAVFSEDEYSELIDYTSSVCRVYESNSLKPNQEQTETVFFALIEIAKRWHSTDAEGNDSGFWEFVYKMCSVTNTQKAYNFFIKTICDMGNSICVAEGVRDKYYATILMHALSPSKSLFAFFDLCYDVYKLDLDFDYASNDKGVLELVAVRFQEILESGRIGDKEGISIGSKAYNIQIGLRVLALHKNISNEFLNLIERTIQQINKLFHQDTIELFGNGDTYFELQLKVWWNSRKADAVQDRKKQSNVRRAVYRDNISAKFVCDESNAYLLIPAIRLKSTDIVPKLQIFVCDECVIHQELKTRIGDFTTTTKEEQFPLSTLLEKASDADIRVEIHVGNECIYNSNASLTRQFILFGEEKEILKHVNLPNNYYLYTKEIDKIGFEIACVQRIGLDFYAISTKAGEHIKGKYRTIIFSEQYKENQICTTMLLGAQPNVIYLKGEQSYSVYNNQITLVVSKTMFINDLELRIGSKRLLVSKLTGNKEEFHFIYDLTKYIDNHYTDIQLYSHKNEKILLCQYVALFPELSVNFNEKLYYNQSEKSVSIKYKDLDIVKLFSNKDETVCIDLSDGQLAITIPWLKWRIDDSDWNNSSTNREFWYEDIVPTNGSILEIEIPFNVEQGTFVIVSDDDNQFEVSCENGKYSIGKVVYSNSKACKFVAYYIIYDEKYKLFALSFEEHFLHNPLEYCNGNLLWQPEQNFIGASDSKFDVELISGDRTYPVSDLQIQNYTFLYVPEGVYSVKVYKKIQTLFIEKRKELFSDRIIVGRKEKFRFHGKALRINEVLLQMDEYKTDDDSWMKLSADYFIDNLSFFEESDGTGYYKGSLFYLKRNQEKIYLDTMPNTSDELEQINPVRIELRSNNSFWLVAGYQKEGEFLGDLFYSREKRQICDLDKPICKFAMINLYRFSEVKDV